MKREREGVVGGTGIKEESARLGELYGIQGLLTEQSDPLYDSIVERVAEICQVPMASFSLVDIDRQWFKARVGLSACQTPRKGSFCDHAIRQDGLFMVENALEDPRFRDHPMVAGGPRLRFYAAQTIFGPNGHPVGTLCIMDQRPRSLTEDQQFGLSLLAHRLQGSFASRSLPATASREHMLRGFYASIMSNCDWLYSETDDEDMREAIMDIQNALGSIMHLQCGEGANDTEFEDTDEWERNALPDTAEAH